MREAVLSRKGRVDQLGLPTFTLLLSAQDLIPSVAMPTEKFVDSDTDSASDSSANNVDVQPDHYALHSLESVQECPPSSQDQSSDPWACIDTLYAAMADLFSIETFDLEMVISLNLVLALAYMICATEPLRARLRHNRLCI